MVALAKTPGLKGANIMANAASIDWRANDALDDDIDTFDLPPVTHSFFANDKAHPPHPNTTLSLQIDSDIVNWFRSQGTGWERRMAAALRLYMEVHKEEMRPEHR